MAYDVRMLCASYEVQDFNAANCNLLVLCPGKKFQSATSFSIHCKRMQTPNKQGDDGWKSVLYEGQPLDMYRKRFASAKPLRPAARRSAAAAAAAASDEGDEVACGILSPYLPL